MRRSIFAALVAALLIVSPVFAKAGASITAPDGLVVGDSFMPTYVPANGKDRDWWAYAKCSQDGLLVWAQYVHLEPGPDYQGPFVLNSPRWPGGGAACTIELLAYEGTYSGIPIGASPYAVDDFAVGP